MQFQLLASLHIGVEVGVNLFDDDLKFPNIHRMARAVHVVAHVLGVAPATLLAIFPEVFQRAVVVAQVPAIPAGARTAAVDLVARTGHVSRACRARVLAVLTVRAVIAKLE